MNKKGSAIVEAVMVFPVIIVSVICVLHILIYFYNQLDERADMHMALRHESGKVCGNMFYENQKSNEFAFYRKPQQIYSYGTVYFRETGFLEKAETDIEARKYLIDETALIRLTDLAVPEGETDEQ